MTRRQYEGRHVDPVRRMRPRFRDASSSKHAGVFRCAPNAGEAVASMFLEDHRVFRGRVACFNSVHGRMPSIRERSERGESRLTYVGVAGDGDSLSIGIGQLVHAIRP